MKNPITKTAFTIVSLVCAMVSTEESSAQSIHKSDVYGYNVNRIEQHQTVTYNHVRRIIRLPRIEGYHTMKCDFHIHTVFSDGDVWPTARVEEAWREGLDAMSITDHTSAEPSKKNVIGGPNSSYEIAKPEAERLGMILIQGTEISRGKKSGGHLNALFITDAVPTLAQDTDKAIDAAHSQGAYIIWNHPGWAIDSCTMFEPNERWIREGKVHAVEVYNEAEWYPRALSWVKDYNLAATAASDIHPLSEGQYRIGEGSFRPMTLVFATDRTPEALKEALLDRRTLAWFNGWLAGREDLLKKFFAASVTASKVSENEKNEIYLLSNSTDIPYEIIHDNGRMTYLPANSQTNIEVAKGTASIAVKVNNMHTYEYQTLQTKINLK